MHLLLTSLHLVLMENEPSRYTILVSLPLQLDVERSVSHTHIPLPREDLD
jgi:hypothetical protein